MYKVRVLITAYVRISKIIPALSEYQLSLLLAFIKVLEERHHAMYFLIPCLASYPRLDTKYMFSYIEWKETYALYFMVLSNTIFINILIYMFKK